MSRVLTFLPAFLLALAGPSGAMPLTPAARAEAFATCTGTYTAEVEHARLFGGAPVAAAEARRAGFAALSDAVSPHLAASGAAEGGPASAELRALRVQARLAQRALLSDATFHTDPGRRSRAAEAAKRRRAACDGLLLGA